MPLYYSLPKLADKLHAEIGDIHAPISELHRILSVAKEKGLVCGAEEAMLIQVNIAIAELKDFQKKFAKSGFCPQMQIDTTPKPERRKAPSWVSGCRKFNRREVA